jgi:1,4-alpha-glucan branching enzyme
MAKAGEFRSASSSPRHISIQFEPESQMQKQVEMAFILEHRGVEHACLCGDFNRWQPVSLHMVGRARAGRWEKKIILPPGRYEYKFVVDGKWIHDPDARENIANAFGTLNSVVDVEPRTNLLIEENL